MPKYELVDIDENNLKDVSLSKEKLNSINSKLLKQIENLSKYNSNLNIDTSLPNIFKAISTSKNNLTSSHGIPNENILKELIIQAVEETLNIDNQDIIFKGFFLAGGGNEFLFTNINPGGFTYYYQVYLTDVDIIIYSFGLNFNLIDTKKFLLKTIDSAGIFNKNYDSQKLDHNYLVMNLTPKNNLYTSSFYFVSYKDSSDITLNEFLNALTEKGIKKFTIKFSKTTIFLLISLFFVFLYYLYILFSN